MTSRTAHLSIRLYEQDKAAFAAGTERCGMDPSVGARMLLELVVQRMAQGGDFIDALHELKNAWQVPKQEPNKSTPAPRRGNMRV